ncbi:hypothetical protein FGO68_gene15574 [Halteria grandinella]|uniref:2,4-dienoyl-CoA reductase [(3E)-enoyl-CoA-producing] n=1 Tax=Halteria grandinella TaxID=5974 RepID=A0A8J8SZL4_HALGN|nr:hypothetical protein FGO68_gene15574 [Halteria grandinella]
MCVISTSQYNINRKVTLMESPNKIAPPTKSYFSPELLKGQVAIVTGGSRGGMLKEIAQAYLQHGCKAVFNTYFNTHGGVIINISAALHWAGSALQVHSGAAKAGVDTITKTLAVEWGPHKVRVVGIVPGAIEGTEGFERLGDLANMNNKEKSKQAFEKGDAKQAASGFKDSMVIAHQWNQFGCGRCFYPDIPQLLIQLSQIH